ncbi:MAG: hypothetical protein ABSE18_02450 [Minisyncoccia bacterium]|jgi:hypothetical protein
MVKKYIVHIVWFVVAIVAFVGGMYYGKATASPSFAGRGAFASSTRSGTGRTGSGGGFVTGSIISKDAQSLTVQLANGNSEVVFYSSSTSVIKPSAASVSDLTPGTSVIIGGTQNSDGSVTAQTIQVRGGNAPGPGSSNGGGSGVAPSGQ